MIDYKFSEIIRLNKNLEERMKGKPALELRLISNITINQLTSIYEFYLRSNELNAKVTTGDYDNILQESSTLKGNAIPVIFWELSNLKDSFVYEIESMNDDEITMFSDKVKNELNILFENTKKSSLVIFNKFSHIIFTNSSLKKSNFENFVSHLNQYLEQALPSNYVLIDIDKIIAKNSITTSIDLRNYYSSKALYSVDFFKTYTLFSAPIFLSMFSKTKKAIIFDCDNTLWKGIIGEDGLDKIELSKKSKSGIYFREVQLLAKSLVNKGIILGICSKNNPKDVEEVFEKHSEMLLKSNDIIIRKVNWLDKPSNLSDIAKELNIGVDSLVFIDDSDFEINLVKEKLPQILTIQVPEKLYDYPKLILDQMNLFYSKDLSSEDLKRATMYKENLEREQIKNTYQNISDYLASLEIKVVFFSKEFDHLERIAQMTQKTNQFNLTTKRYTLNEIKKIYESNEYDVISLDVSDKYGSSGVTGLCIICYTNEQAEIDTLLMSCRILGRNIEKIFLDEIIKTTHARNIKYIKSKYLKTVKNTQVEDFYEKHHFKLIESNSIEKSYCLYLETYKNDESLNYINTKWKKK